MGFRGGGQIDPPPSVSWFSSTPVGIGLIFAEIKTKLAADILSDLQRNCMVQYGFQADQAQGRVCKNSAYNRGATFDIRQ